MELNRRQRVVLAAAAIGILAMLLYPPFHVLGRGVGYGWLFDPPHPQGTVNAAQLTVQWAGLAMVTGIVLLLLGQSKSSPSTTAARETRDPQQALGPSHRVLILWLRVFRGLALLVAILQLASFVNTVSAVVTDPDPYRPFMGTVVAHLTIKAVVCAAALGLAVFLRAWANRIHIRAKGEAHPALSRWIGL